MRLKLSLISKDKFFPFNYNYYLSSAVYKLLQFGSPEFTDFLHNRGYVLNGRPYKLFTYALRFNSVLARQNYFCINSPKAFLFISSPLVEGFIKNFIIGTFENRCIEIFDSGCKCRFEIEQIESLPDKTINDFCYIRLLSPIVLSNVEERNGARTQRYLRYNDDILEINRVFNQNLKNKYKLVYNKDYSGADVLLNWDNDYITKKLAEGKRLTRKVSVIKNNERPIEIIANVVPFTLTGSTELIKVGYECGYGEKNSTGFGMGEIV